MNKAIENFLKFLKSRGLSLHTIRAYQTDLTQLEEFISHFFPDEVIKVEQIERLMLRDFLRHKSEEGNSNRSLARKATTLKEFFQFCFKNELINTNPAAQLKIPKFEKNFPNFSVRKK